jgi:hypothetical protein
LSWEEVSYCGHIKLNPAGGVKINT